MAASKRGTAAGCVPWPSRDADRPPSVCTSPLRSGRRLRVRCRPPCLAGARSSRCVIGECALSLPRAYTPRPQHQPMPPGTARTPKSCTATPSTPVRCTTRRVGQQHAWRGPTATSTACLASYTRSASRQAGDRTRMTTSPHRPPQRPTPSRLLVPLHEGCSRVAPAWQACAALGTKGSPTIGKRTRCRVQAVVQLWTQAAAERSRSHSRPAGCRSAGHYITI